MVVRSSSATRTNGGLHLLAAPIQHDVWRSSREAMDGGSTIYRSRPSFTACRWHWPRLHPTTTTCRLTSSSNQHCIGGYQIHLSPSMNHPLLSFLHKTPQSTGKPSTGPWGPASINLGREPKTQSREGSPYNIGIHRTMSARSKLLTIVSADLQDMGLGV